MSENNNIHVSAEEINMAWAIIKNHENSAGHSILQRKMAIGYNKATAIIDKMEEIGILGPFRGSKPREVLVSTDVEVRSLIDKFASVGIVVYDDHQPEIENFIVPEDVSMHQPTMDLRWVERSVPFNSVQVERRKILQQKFVDLGSGKEIWKDIPLEEEE